MSTYETVHNVRNVHDDQCDILENNTTMHLKDDRTMGDVFTYLGDLFGRLTSELGELFSLHMDLLKAEARDSAKVLARNSAMLAVAAALGWFAFTGITLALIAVIAAYLPIESQLLAFAAGAAIVGVVYGIIAGGLAFAGIKHLQSSSLAPDRTIHEIKRDKQAVKEIK